ncbi:MAG: hypothetical protein D6776_00245, partial [Planctomycetota bacterium]
STLYEELDLALRLQQRPPTPHRLPVRYVPEAIVIEHDAPPVTGLRVQVPEAELATLRERHPELAHHEPESIERLLVAAQRSAGPRVLVIAPALPRRDTPRLSARLAQELDNALQAGRATSLLPLDPDDPDRMASVLARRGVRVLPLPRDERPLPERLAQRLEELAPYHFEQILLLAPRLGPTVREATARWEPRPEIRRLVTGDDEPAEVR